MVEAAPTGWLGVGRPVGPPVPGAGALASGTGTECQPAPPPDPHADHIAP